MESFFLEDDWNSTNQETEQFVLSVTSKSSPDEKYSKFIWLDQSQISFISPGYIHIFFGRFY